MVYGRYNELVNGDYNGLFTYKTGWFWARAHVGTVKIYVNIPAPWFAYGKWIVHFTKMQKLVQRCPKAIDSHRLGRFLFWETSRCCRVPISRAPHEQRSFLTNDGGHIPAVNRWYSSYNGVFQWWIHDNEPFHSLPLYQLLNSRGVWFLICLAFPWLFVY